MIRRLATNLAGLVLVEPEVHGDERGFLVETFRDEGVRAAGITAQFVQENQSRSRRGTLRGMHFQVGSGQGKLVRVARGRILDVAVDLRRSSPTFGSYESIELDDLRHRSFYVPVGFAHGFVVLSDEADVCYKVTAYYDPSAERGLRWDDPTIGIDWPIGDPLLSDRDRALPDLSELAPDLPDW